MTAMAPPLYPVNEATVPVAERPPRAWAWLVASALFITLTVVCASWLALRAPASDPRVPGLQQQVADLSQEIAERPVVPFLFSITLHGEHVVVACEANPQGGLSCHQVK